MAEESNIIQAVRAAGLLDEGQTRQLDALIRTLTPQQALWLSGYLAALGHGAPSANGNGAAHAATAPATGGGPRITVLYGTETGNAQGIAEELAAKATGKGLNAQAIDMADYRTKDLRDETHLALVTATHGEGDPPDPAAGFFEFLWGRKAPKLEGAKFCVLSLGDESYVEFCKAGKDLDQRFEELGGERLLDRVDCDVDYEDAAEAWIEELVGVLEEVAAPAGDAGSAAAPGAPGGVQTFVLGGGVGAAAPAKPAFTKKSPYEAEILESFVLNGRHSDKETRHIELLVEEGALPFEPGDSLGIIATNEEAVTSAVMEALELTPADSVSVGGEDKPLAEALEHDLELTLLTPGFLKSYAEAAEAEDLRRLVEAEDRAELNRFMKCNQVIDILEQYPVTGLDAQSFVDMLRKLQPRLYSIASSQIWLPDQIDLTVAVTRYTADGKRRNGVASTFLAERREPGDTVQVYVESNKGFRLPADPDGAMLMIGPGTGVAPFRAFLQEREETGASGRNWLFFGDRTFREDFLYQTEWQRFLDDGRLTRMDVAFSRDQAEKVYVQDRIRERSRDVYEWLEEGAYLYVCGDADGMAPAVHEALLQVIADEGGHSPEDAEAYLKGLAQEKRYQRDVY